MPAPLDPAVPIVVSYGKFGPAKGTFDLVAALGRLKALGRAFHFVALGGGESRWVERFHEAVRAADLDSETRLVPFIAHWRVPSVLRAATAVCFLEHDFPIERHSPIVPQEVMAVGSPLVTTVEIARKQPFAPLLVHGDNILLVRNPRDHEELAAVLDRVITEPDAVAAIGRRGHLTLPKGQTSEVIERYEDVFAHACDRKQRPARRVALSGSRFPDPRARRSRSRRQPAYMADVLRWERCQIPDPARAGCADDQFFRASSVDGIGHWIPQVAPNVDIVSFRYDMPALMRALGRRKRPSSWPEQPTHFAVQHNRSARTRAVKLGSGVYAFIARLDGRSRVDTVLRRARGLAGGDEFGLALDAVTTLFREGILTHKESRCLEPRTPSSPNPTRSTP